MNHEIVTNIGPQSTSSAVSGGGANSNGNGRERMSEQLLSVNLTITKVGQNVFKSKICSKCYSFFPPFLLTLNERIFPLLLIYG